MVKLRIISGIIFFLCGIIIGGILGPAWQDGRVVAAPVGPAIIIEKVKLDNDWTKLKIEAAVSWVYSNNT